MRKEDHASDSTTQTRPNRLHTHTHPPKRLAHPRSPIPPLSTLTSSATHAHPTLPRSTGFCAIWDCISSSSSSRRQRDSGTHIKSYASGMLRFRLRWKRQCGCYWRSCSVHASLFKFARIITDHTIIQIAQPLLLLFRSNPPLSWGGSDLNSSSCGCARLGSGVAPPIGVVKEEVAVFSCPNNKNDGGILIFQRRNPRQRYACRPPCCPWVTREGRACEGRGAGWGLAHLHLPAAGLTPNTRAPPPRFPLGDT